MQIHVNGEPRELADGTRLGQLLTALEVPLEAVAVALNLQVVPRSQLAEHPLSDGDRVEVVRAVGGG
ncbi:MAG: sulfur carrier protein ThiS [Myxococcota bacterium]|nr:sulfur carrier protein ThiS [Myxococcota bacterium]